MANSQKSYIVRCGCGCNFCTFGPTTRAGAVRRLDHWKGANVNHWGLVLAPNLDGATVHDVARPERVYSVTGEERSMIWG